MFRGEIFPPSLNELFAFREGNFLVSKFGTMLFLAQEWWSGVRNYCVCVRQV